ncbi:MAG: SDR family NAD(P)-dependent oxidoreductase, partial [Chromatiaceae bacterium]|nr:SDR family NAD(P)-dependent oxidoreductase [Chromatiaceae bacterium]
MLRRCGGQLATILSGKTDPLEVLFGQDKNQVAEHFYQDSPSPIHYNGLVASCVESAVAAAPRDRKLRILEIGAGTGGLTTYVLPVLRPESTEYLFTDISSAFFDQARKKLQGFDFVEYRALNIESAPDEQGLPVGEFDLILASQVLHACRDLREALRHVYSLLAPSGMLLFLEIERPRAWIDTIFGTMEGWWRFQDQDLRQNHPLMPADRWVEILLETGFAGATPMRIESDASKAQQVVMRARKPISGIDERQLTAALEIEADHAQNWLVFADDQGLAELVCERLKGAGHRVTKVSEGTDFGIKGDRELVLSAGDRVCMGQLLERLVSKAEPVTGVLYLWPLSAPALDEDTQSAPADGEALTCYALMHLLQAWEQSSLDLPQRLLLVTRNAQPAIVGELSPQLAQSPTLGIGRVIVNEHSQAGCCLVDLQEKDAADEAEAILHEIACDDDEIEVVWRQGVRYAARVQHAGRPSSQVDPLSPTPPRFRLFPSDIGVLDRLVLREIESDPLRTGEVEIRVRAAALNFRDVLKALGLYPSDGGDFMLLGDECAGEITAVGPDVADYAPGDRVLAISPGSFGSYARSRQEMVVPIPAGMSFNAAVTIPIAFLTAYYSLHSLGQIRAGDKVLIQAAAGGVGLAALQIAKLAGAEVFATAGTTEKRELLRLLGADHVMSSRSLAFADEIKMLTGGRGVDIVLNSLAGEAIRKGIDCLAPYGRFLELGKRDIYQDNKIGLWGFRSNISFHAIDLSRVIQHRPDFVREMLQRIVGHLAKGELSALPLRPFPVSRIVEAFRYMAQARHTGKVVITMDGSPVSVERHLPAEIEIDSNARYLISGGLGGFGLKVAEWLVEKGADHLVLVGRSGAASTEAQQAVAALEAQGATVDVQCVDISDPVQTDALLAGLTREGPPLKGVFHAAMVIDDGILLQLDKERFRRAMAPKVDGCWNLHRSTLEQPLDYFVLFSSLSAVVGNPGQANYAAANAFLDAFAYYRRAHGLPALSVNWGPIVGAGYIEKNREVAESLDKRGLLGLNTARAIKILESLLAQNVTNIG